MSESTAQPETVPALGIAAAWPRWSTEAVLTGRPRIRVNQVGYLRSGPKRAVLVTEASTPLRFELVTADMQRVLDGLTAPWPVRPEPTSGLAIHVIEFGVLETPGDGYHQRRLHPLERSTGLDGDIPGRPDP